MKKCSICGKDCCMFIWANSRQIPDEYRKVKDGVICLECYKSIELVRRTNKPCPCCGSTDIGEKDMFGTEEADTIELYCRDCGRILCIKIIGHQKIKGTFGYRFKWW